MKLRYLSRYIFIFFIILSSAFMGCGRKQEALQESQEPLSVDIISTANIPDEFTSQEIMASEKEPIIPRGSYKPTNRDIQIALKNAGFYKDKIDGKIGPLAKKAIKEFQKAHNLKIDGIVGPKTWEVLSVYLTPEDRKGFLR